MATAFGFEWQRCKYCFTVIATTGVLVRDNVYFNGRRVAYFSPGSGNQHYYWQDHLGSASKCRTVAVARIEWESDNYPFGTPRLLTNGLENHFRFTGYEHDPETVYYYADYREQSPNLGRFFSPDPLPGSIADPRSLNRYSYALNDPINTLTRILNRHRKVPPLVYRGHKC